MSEFEILHATDVADVEAPDGSRVRPLLRTSAASMVHIELGAGGCSRAIAHGEVDEIWFVVSGRGQMWRARGGDEIISQLTPGSCVSIAHGTHFQFRADPDGPLSAIAVTMPPWPGDAAAHEVPGIWRAAP